MKIKRVPICKTCHIKGVKNGFSRGKQRYLCKKCGKNFVYNERQFFAADDGRILYTQFLNSDDKLTEEFAEKNGYSRSTVYKHFKLLNDKHYGIKKKLCSEIRLYLKGRIEKPTFENLHIDYHPESLHIGIIVKRDRGVFTKASYRYRLSSFSKDGNVLKYLVFDEMHKNEVGSQSQAYPNGGLSWLDLKWFTLERLNLRKALGKEIKIS